ncbi:TonB-dependent receptor domain-containing protein [Oceanisphaera psychrotolerans]|uniref:TonB-dependent receptor domain-containing protein n=1 Tax=Oceanisphaera psychrotolerans TaxID=1414654 RepID=UPI00158792E3|nr:TonB-dependent receptor [Oceanisphaera psychrotolerans]
MDTELTLYNTEASLFQGSYDYAAGTSSYGADLRNKSQLGDHGVTYGMDYRHDEGEFSAPGESYKDVGHVTGLYVQDHYQLTDYLMLSAGTRYDWYQLDEGLSGRSYSESGLSPNLGFSLDATDRLNLHGGWARAIRGPQLKELYLMDTYSYDPDIKEEVADNYELGAIYRYGNLTLTTTAFVSHIDDVVGRSSGMITNLGDLKTRGFTAGIGYDWERVSASLSYSQARPELDGEPLSDGNMGIGTSIGDTWVANLDFQPVDSVDLGWTGRVSERLTTVADGYSEKPGFGVHDVYARWRPLAGDQLTLSLTVNNLFDKQYLDHATYADPLDITAGLPEAGRDIRLGAAYRF